VLIGIVVIFSIKADTSVSGCPGSAELLASTAVVRRQHASILWGSYLRSFVQETTGGEVVAIGEGFGDMPLVSIGVPVFNGERFLRQSLDCLVGQTYRNVEIIISDNASEDDTETICREYASRDTRVRYIRHDRNRGAAWNWNYVVFQAKGEYFKWASSNDLCDLGMVEACVAALSRNVELINCYGRTVLLDDEGRQMEEYAGDLALEQELPGERFVTLITQIGLNNGQCGVMRRAVLLSTGLERPYISGDLVLMGELALRGKFRMLDQVLFYRRVGGQSLSARRSTDDLHKFLEAAPPVKHRAHYLRRMLDHTVSVVRAPVRFRDKRAALCCLVRRLYATKRYAISEVLGLLVGRLRW
jgi:glycosyltransferase involved in cell wall biosynthesis